MHEFPRFQPMDRSGIYCHSFFCGKVWTILKIVVLSFMLTFKIKTGKSSKIFFAYSFVDSCTSTNTFSIKVSSVGPPISFAFYVTKNHVFNRSRQTRDFPRNVCFPATPGFTEMLNYSFSFICLDSFWHHILDVEKNGSTEFKVKLRFYSLFTNRFGHSFGMTSFKLTSKKITQPSF